MKTISLRQAAASLIVFLAAILAPQCTKEDYGLTKEARATIEKLLGDYGCHLVTWSPKAETKAGVLVLVDTLEAKEFKDIELSLVPKTRAGERGTVVAEVPFLKLVRLYSAFFRNSPDTDLSCFPKSWTVSARYEVDPAGNVVFLDYEYDEIDGCLLAASFCHDIEEGRIVLSFFADISDEGKIDLGDFLNEFFSGEFQTIYRKND